MSKIVHTGLRMVTVVVLTATVFSFCYASERPQRFAVELEVFAANAHVLLSPAVSSRYKRGLRLRMASALGSFRFLAREYLENTDRTNHDLLPVLGRLQRLFRQGKWQALALQSSVLAKRYPFDMRGLEPRQASDKAISSGRHIYQHLCMGCHEHPDSTQLVPAPNMFAMARTEPARELIARLIAGVHGTPAVALRNPFSNAEIAGLAAYLLSHAVAVHQDTGHP